MPVHVAEDPLVSRRPRRRQVRRGVRGAPAGAGLRARGGSDECLDTARRPGAPLAQRSTGLDGAQPAVRASLLVALVLACVIADHARRPRRRRLAARAGPPGGRRGVRPLEAGVAAAVPPVHRGARLVPLATTTCATSSATSRPRTPSCAPRSPPSGFDRNRLEEYDGLTAAADEPRLRAGPGPGRRARPVPVVLAAPSPSTPAPTPACTPDMTVLNNDGLVGRVLRVTRTTATVLLDRRRRLGRRRPGRRRAWRSASSRGRGVARRRRPARPRAGRRLRGPGQARHRRHLGQRGRRAVRRRRPDRPGHRGLQQPARDLPAGRDRAVRRLRLARPGRRRGAVRHRAATAP